MSNSSKEKKGTPISVKILFPLAILTVSLIVSLFDISNSVNHVRDEVSKITDVYIATMANADQIRFDVAETSYAFDEMKLEKKLDESLLAPIKSDVIDCIEISKEMDPYFADSWDAVCAEYEEYCDICTEMVNAYIGNNSSKANELATAAEEKKTDLILQMNTCINGMEGNLEKSSVNIDTNIRNLINSVSFSHMFDIVMCIVVGWLFIRFIVKPVKKLTARLKKLSDKDISDDDMKVKSKDEVATLTAAYNSLKASLREIMEVLNDTTKELAETTSTVSTHSETIVRNVQEITQAINGVAQNAGDQAGEVEAASNEVENLQDIIVRNDETTRNLEKASEQISQASAAGNKVVSDLYEVTSESEKAFDKIFDAIVKIKESTAHIGEASGMIESIASQTSLLSLNASIEAARAGEMGRGFAVVAEEIRKLSDESASSVNEINEMLKELQNNVEIATSMSDSVKVAVEKQVKGVNDTQSSYEEITNSLEIIDNEIKGLGAVSKSMTESCSNVTMAMEGLSAAAQENAASAEETNAGIEEVLAMVQEIADGSSAINELSDDLAVRVATYKL